MREFIAVWADRGSLRQEDTFTACLVATEAVTNAMRHACPDDAAECPIVVACRLEGPDLLIEVTDRGRFRTNGVGGDDDGGRGLFLIRELTSGFSLHAGEDGTRLSMRLAAREPAFAGSHAA